jgi:type II secretory pathway predicted ATPase ExeA
MYEAHFGMTGLPFQLSPDPHFYFDSRSHHGPLTELRAVLGRSPGFIVISGEIGAQDDARARVDRRPRPGASRWLNS